MKNLLDLQEDGCICLWKEKVKYSLGKEICWFMWSFTRLDSHFSLTILLCDEKIRIWIFFNLKSYLLNFNIQKFFGVLFKITELSKYMFSPSSFLIYISSSVSNFVKKWETVENVQNIKYLWLDFIKWHLKKN